MCIRDRYYPAEAAKLRAAVEQYMSEAKVPELPGRYVACVTPHSAYPFAGAVAGHAFAPLKHGQYDRVIVLASSHFAAFEGCSIPAVQLFRTPLGDVELDGPAIGRLQWCPQIDTRSLTSKRAKRFSDGTMRVPMHEIEYSIEAILPFLQARLGRFKLVPVLVGEFEGREGIIDAKALESAAKALREIVDDRTFIVVSTDLTHFGNAYGYRPPGEDVQTIIEDLDTQAMELIMDRNLSGFRVYMKATENRICGMYALELLMQILPRSTKSVLLDYRTSGGITGSTESSVSYASIAFFNPLLPPAEGRPPLVVPASRPGGAVKAPPLVPEAKPARPEAAAPKEQAEKKGILRRLGLGKP